MHDLHLSSAVQVISFIAYHYLEKGREIVFFLTSAATVCFLNLLCYCEFGQLRFWWGIVEKKMMISCMVLDEGWCRCRRQ